MTIPTSLLQVRRELVDALHIDLVGPTGPPGDHHEVLPQTPSWSYLTGFLVATDADEGQRCDPGSNDKLIQAAESAGIEDDDLPGSLRGGGLFLPNSVGLSILVPETPGDVHAAVRYRVWLPVGAFPVEMYNCMMYVTLEPSHIRALQD
jgi:hypothetical protein